MPSEIGAEEAEEVGVEHLLRDIKDTTVGSLSQRLTRQLNGLKGLEEKIVEIKNYLIEVIIISFVWYAADFKSQNLQWSLLITLFSGWRRCYANESSNFLSASRYF